MTSHDPTTPDTHGSPPSTAEIAALTARLRHLRSPQATEAERAAFRADKDALLARIPDPYHGRDDTVRDDARRDDTERGDTGRTDTGRGDTERDNACRDAAVLGRLIHAREQWSGAALPVSGMPEQDWHDAVDALREAGHRIDTTTVTGGETWGDQTGYILQPPDGADPPAPMPRQTDSPSPRRSGDAEYAALAFDAAIPEAEGLLVDEHATATALRAAEAGDWPAVERHYAVTPGLDRDQQIQQLRDELAAISERRAEPDTAGPSAHRWPTASAPDPARAEVDRAGESMGAVGAARDYDGCVVDPQLDRDCAAVFGAAVESEIEALGGVEHRPLTPGWNARDAEVYRQASERAQAVTDAYRADRVGERQDGTDTDTRGEPACCEDGPASTAPDDTSRGEDILGYGVSGLVIPPAMPDVIAAAHQLPAAATRAAAEQDAADTARTAAVGRWHTDDQHTDDQHTAESTAGVDDEAVWSQ